jgi:hypothetical protein
MMTKGEYRVGVTFNPSNNPTVDAIKAKVAEIIDMIEAIPLTDCTSSIQANERSRLKAIAQTEFEGACHFAVKAATKPDVEGMA